MIYISYLILAPLQKSFLCSCLPSFLSLSGSGLFSSRSSPVVFVAGQIVSARSSEPLTESFQNSSIFFNLKIYLNTKILAFTFKYYLSYRKRCQKVEYRMKTGMCQVIVKSLNKRRNKMFCGLINAIKTETEFSFTTEIQKRTCALNFELCWFKIWIVRILKLKEQLRCKIETKSYK
jgi:hypothetical protein